MPSYVAFLRAINLGARRKFPKDDIRAAVEGCGCTGVETFINTGNVRLTTTLRSTRRVECVLEAAFLADRGFEVPTVVLTSAELREVAADAASLAHPGRHYVELLRDPPAPDVVAELEASSGAVHAVHADHVVHVGRRAVHFLVPDGYAGAALLRKGVEKRLGVTTNRNATVITELAARWGA